jgi:hypothetical protein
MRNVVQAVIGAVALVTAVAAADPAYVGKWKFNTSKSSLTGDSVTIENSAGGTWHFNSQGFAYSFKLDGKPNPTPDGGTTAWTATSATVWDVSNKIKDKVTSTYHLVLNGDVLAVSGKSMKSDGGSMDFSSTYKRVSGGPGFAGKWRSSEVKAPANTLEIAPSGANGVTMKDDGGPICNAQFDGKDSPALGRMAGSSYTYVLKKLQGSSFEVTTKVGGKPFDVEVYAVSADGKMLTISGTPSDAKDEPYKLVFDRQ